MASGSIGRMEAAARRGIGYLAFTPYWERAFLRSLTPAASSVPRMTLYRKPGRSLTRPPRTRTTECSWRLWPSPGMYAPTSMPFVRRTRATFRSAEFVFFGVVVYTRVHTPRRCGAATFFLRPLPDLRPGVASFFLGAWRPLRINWLVVGMRQRRLAGAHGCRPPRARGRRRAGGWVGAGRHQAGTPARATSTLTCCTPTASATGA